MIEIFTRAPKLWPKDLRIICSSFGCSETLIWHANCHDSLSHIRLTLLFVQGHSDWVQQCRTSFTSKNVWVSAVCFVYSLVNKPGENRQFIMVLPLTTCLVVTTGYWSNVVVVVATIVGHQPISPANTRLTRKSTEFVMKIRYCLHRIYWRVAITNTISLFLPSTKYYQYWL